MHGQVTEQQQIIVDLIVKRDMRIIERKEHVHHVMHEHTQQMEIRQQVVVHVQQDTIVQVQVTEYSVQEV